MSSKKMAVFGIYPFAAQAKRSGCLIAAASAVPTFRATARHAKHQAFAHVKETKAPEGATLA